MSAVGAKRGSRLDRNEPASAALLREVVARVGAMRAARCGQLDVKAVAEALADLGGNFKVEADDDRSLVHFKDQPLVSFSPTAEVLWRARVSESRAMPDPASDEYRRGIARGYAQMRARSKIIAAGYIGVLRSRRTFSRTSCRRREHSPRRRRSHRSSRATRAGPNGDGDDDPGDVDGPHGRRGARGPA